MPRTLGLHTYATLPYSNLQLTFALPCLALPLTPRYCTVLGCHGVQESKHREFWQQQTPPHPLAPQSQFVRHQKSSILVARFIINTSCNLMHGCWCSTPQPDVRERKGKEGEVTKVGSLVNLDAGSSVQPSAGRCLRTHLLTLPLKAAALYSILQLRAREKRIGCLCRSPRRREHARYLRKEPSVLR